MNFSLKKRRLNPIVDRYVTTDLPLLEIIRHAPGSDAPVPKALLLLQECMAGQRLAREAVDMAGSLPLQGADPELLALLLATWAEFSCRIARPSDAEAILHCLKSLIGEQTHPEIRATATYAQSVLADTTGNRAAGERLVRDILSDLSPHSPRRKFYVWELALLLARQGRAIEAKSELNDLTWRCNERFPITRIHLVQFVDAVETGRIQAASSLMTQIENARTAALAPVRLPYQGYKALLGLMHSHARQQPPPHAELPAKSPAWVYTVQHLLEHKCAEALREARIEAKKMLNSIFGTGFESLNLVRAELAAQHWEAARRLIEMRRARGNRHYLDDFYLAQAEKLADNPRAAGRHFGNLMRAIDRYQAQGRLKFELAMATGLSQSDLVEITRAGEQHRQEKPSKLPLSLARIKTAAPPVTAAGNSDGQDLPVTTLEQMILGRSVQAAGIREAVLRFAELDAPVLITGETGTGKELIARALHEMSKRRRLRFTAVNCGSITETLLESELFGHERGAFTGAERSNKGLFEETGKGTILLDEIGDISPRLQTALLRVMETGEIRAVGSSRTRTVNCRILAATNAELAQLAEQKQFRKDLLYRLQRIGIHLPPLRERRDDILLLARRFLDEGRRVGVHASLSKDLREALQAYDWPGNVRELRNVIERMRLMHSDKQAYSLRDLDLRFQPVNRAAAGASPAPPRPATVKLPLPPAGLQRPAAPATQRQPAIAPAPAATLQVPPAEPDIASLLRTGKSPMRRLERLRTLFRQHQRLTRGEIIRILGVAPNTATKDLKLLCEEGFILRIEPSASTRSHYFELKHM